MPRSAGMTWRRSGAWVTGCAEQDPGSQMPIRLRLAVAFAMIAAALYALGGWLFASGLSLTGGESVDAYEATQSQVVRELAIGGVVFVAIAALGAYWLARAALSPVERLRQQVAAVSGRDEGSAVEVPGTGDEIAALAGTMNELLGRLQGALARQRAFVADASHELRTPLAVLRGELELAARPGRSRDDLAAAVRNAAAEAERLSQLTDDLLLLARSDEDRLSLRPAATDIGKLLARSAGSAGSRFGRGRGHLPRRRPGRDAGRCRQRPYPAGGRQPPGQRAAVRPARLGDRACRPPG